MHMHIHMQMHMHMMVMMVMVVMASKEVNDRPTGGDCGEDKEVLTEW